jgi:AcrR family transcriptional regulator
VGPGRSRAVATPAPRRRRDLAATRQALIEAGAEVFSQRGFAASSLEGIAEAAGFTRGAVHHHFASKEELFLAVIAARDEGLLAGYGDAGWAADPSANVARWQQLHGDGLVDVALRLELHAHALRNEQLRPLVAAVERRAAAATAERLAQRAAAAGVRWRYPVDQVAELLHVTSRGLLEQSVVTGEDVAPLMRTFLAMIWHDAVEEDR